MVCIFSPSSSQLVVPQWGRRNPNLWVMFHRNRRMNFISCRASSSSSSMDDGSFSLRNKKEQMGYDSSKKQLRLESEVNPRDIMPEAPKPKKSWFGPNGQYIRELPCPSCRGRGYIPCTKCDIERTRIDCAECNGEGIRTCSQCVGDCVIWEESIDEGPWEKARSISPLKVKEDDEVDNLDIKLNVRQKSKRVYKSLPPEVGLKISKSLRSLNAKTGLFTKRMKLLHSDPEFRAQRAAAIKKARSTPESRKRTSDFLKTYFSDPENRRKRSLVMKAYYSNPESRRKKSIALKAYFSDPENRRKKSIDLTGAKHHCRICGKEGHTRLNCPDRFEDNGSNRPYNCQLCGEQGHNQRTCPKSKPGESNGNGQRKKRCSSCGEVGHNRRACPHMVLVVKATGDSNEGSVPTEAKRRNLRPTDHSKKGLISTEANEPKKRDVSFSRHCQLCGGKGHNRRTCPSKVTKSSSDPREA